MFGPTAVLVRVTPPHWVIGVLLNNQWSVGGNPLRPPVNAFLAQPFANYNMAHGWYLNTSPIITADWLAAPGQRWTVPVGGGIGRVFRLGDQPVRRIDCRLLQRGKSDWRSGPLVHCELLWRCCFLSNDGAAFAGNGPSGSVHAEGPVAHFPINSIGRAGLRSE